MTSLLVSRTRNDMDLLRLKREHNVAFKGYLG
jgi:hypothetical protein